MFLMKSNVIKFDGGLKKRIVYWSFKQEQMITNGIYRCNGAEIQNERPRDATLICSSPTSTPRGRGRFEPENSDHSDVFGPPTDLMILKLPYGLLISEKL